MDGEFSQSRTFRKRGSVLLCPAQVPQKHHNQSDSQRAPLPGDSLDISRQLYSMDLPIAVLDPEKPVLFRDQSSIP